MTITGYLSEFSLAELFQILEQGAKTGLLTICSLLEPQPAKQHNHYIWFKQGRIVAASSTLDHQGLMRLIQQRGWLGERAATRLTQHCALDTPAGVCLKTQGALSGEQLKLLFYSQVMRQVCALFELDNGWFQFDPQAPIPIAEMTGLNAAATEVTLAGLRALKHWDALLEKLPDPSSALISITPGKPQMKLNPTEWQMWEFANGTVSLGAIAKQIQVPLTKVQQIAFRLMVVGLVEEVPLLMSEPLTPAMPDPEPLHEEMPISGFARSSSSTPTGGENAAVSQSFLQNLVGFLKGKM